MKGNHYQDFLVGKICNKSNITSGYQTFVAFTVQPKMFVGISVFIYATFLIFFVRSSFKDR